MISNLFKVYSVLKNEDALPFIDGNVLIVADGLGGSGSTVHKIDRSKHKDMRSEILQSLFGNYAALPHKFRSYIEEVIFAMSDVKDDTSALWASRIVIARCAYLLTCGEYKGADLGNDRIRDNLVQDLIGKLDSVAKQFGLKADMEEQRLLPTTLAIIRYEEKGDVVVAEALWAGDSRCYAILPEGLKALSQDDEDATGAITNLFYAGNKKCKLNYIRHELPKPCVLMAVSDGVFDPYVPHDHLGVEVTVLGAIADSNSADELGSKLHKHYNTIKGDDATIAFCVVCDSAKYRKFQELFSERTKKVSAIYERYVRLNKVLDLAETPEDADNYVRNRINTKFDYIASDLVEAIAEHGGDVALSEEILSIAVTTKQACGMRKSIKCDERSKKSQRRFADIVSESPERIASILTDEKIKADHLELAGAIERFKQSAQQYADSLRTQKGQAERKRELAEEKAGIEAELNGKKDNIIVRSACADATKTDKETNDYYSQLSRALSCETRDEVDKILKRCGKFKDGIYNRVEEYIIKYFKCKDECAKGDDGIAAAKESYYNAYGDFENIRKKEGVSFRDVCEEKECADIADAEEDGKTDMTAAVVALDEECKRDIVAALKEEREYVSDSIVKAMAGNPDKNSVIDKYFNATNLKAFRMYHKLASEAPGELSALSRELENLDNEYNSLLKKDTE